MSKSALTVVDKLKEVSQRNPQFEALVSYDENMVRSSLTVEELYTLSARFAFLLKKEGVLPGDYVSTTVPLSLEAAIIVFGIVFAGAVPTSLEITFHEGNAMLMCLEKVKSRLICVKDDPKDDVLNMFRPYIKSSDGPVSIMAGVEHDKLPFLKRLMMIRRSNTRDQSFVEMLRRAKDEYVYEGINPHMVAFLHYTTGTEKDYLKLTEITHLNTLRLCDLLLSLKMRPFTKRIYENPWYWLSSIPYDFLYGTTRFFPDKWQPVQDYPLVLLNIAKTEEIKYADLHPAHMMETLKILGSSPDEPLFDQIFVGGMPITRKLLNTLRPISKHFTLIYGSHETGAAHCHQVKASEIDLFTDYDVGIPMPGVQIRIVNDQWQDVEPGQIGRMLLKTPGMFHGYPGEPVRTAQMFDPDFWFITNDKGRINPKNNHLFVGGRIDTLILHGEYMIYPSWVEEVIAPHPGIKEVAVVPVPDAVLFHSVGACIVKKPGATVTKSDITELVSKVTVQGKAKIFMPKHVLFMDDFPRLSDGSVDRSRLYDIVSERVGA